MDDGSLVPWLSAVIMLIIAAFFAVAETSFASSSRSKLKAAAERGDARAQKALYVLDNFDRAITTILIGTNITHLAAASIVTVAVTRIWGISFVSISTILTTIVVFFAAEILPKSIAGKAPEKCALGCASILVFCMKLFYPIAWILTFIGQTASRFTEGDSEVSVSVDELYDIIDDMTERGSLDEERGELVSSALNFGEITAENILTPRVDLTAISIDTPADEILEVIQSSKHSRIPVYDGNIDNIVGILQIRRFLKAYRHQSSSINIRTLLDKVFFVHHSTRISELLPVMSKRHLNIAVITDNFGGTFGIVTVEDILEALIGDVWDEDDVVEEPIIRINENTLLVDADVSVGSVFDYMDLEIPEEDEEELFNMIISEWVYEQFTEIPKPGDSFTYERVEVTVSKMDQNRILKLKVSLLPEKSEGGEE